MDEFRIAVSIVEHQLVTKRLVLSVISRLFDPLGWVAPTVVVAKILMQELWLRKLAWDEELPPDLLTLWKSYCHELACVKNLCIPQWTGQRAGSVIELHGFADASTRMYAAVVYQRVLNCGEKPRISILIAKTKVAPLKPVTIPRLELCAVVLLARLLRRTIDDLKLEHVPVYSWSDSIIVLAWLSKHPSTWPTFVANRVETVHSLVPSVNWRHVSTSENPADCASRGKTSSELLSYKLWWQGPAWLQDLSTAWPSSPVIDYTETIEKKSIRAHVVEMEPTEHLGDKLPTRLESWPKLLRVIAICFRFINYCKRKLSPETSAVPSVTELRRSRLFWLKFIQNQHFDCEIRAITEKIPVGRPSPLRTLSPFMDDERLLRVSGRLNNAPITWDAKHPVILPKHRLSELIAKQAHLRSLHEGSRLTLYLIRQNFWILGARTLVRNINHRCIVCVRQQAMLPAQLMADLPTSPLLVRMGKGRGYQSRKGYTALFVCLSTRALSKDPVLQNHISQNSIVWHFIPPHAPHFGGLWEAGVKSEKHHLRRIIGPQTFTFEELTTLLSQVEASLNSRPLAALSNDPDDLNYLTPGHFLVGGPLLVIPEPSVISLQENRLTRWQLVQRVTEHFWKRWMVEYLLELQKRYKWEKTKNNIKAGDLVLIRDNNLPKSKWNLGRVLTCHPGKDGLVRVVTIKTATSTYKRPITQLCILPVNE